MTPQSRAHFTSRPSDILRAHTCQSCHAPIGVVYCDALPWVLDLRDLTPTEEAQAVLQGRHTFATYGRPGYSWVKWRKPEKLIKEGMPRNGATTILTEHICPGRPE